MKNPLKRRFERYCHYLSDENAEKTYRKLYEILSSEQQIMRIELLAKNSTEKGITDVSYFPKQQVIVSLTTHSKRIYEVFLSIESIMQQTVKPNKIILWLDEKEQNESLPITLQRQQERGLDIRYCKDIGPHTKLIPTLRVYPDDIIITVDDDVIYTYDMLENILRSYQKNPKYIHTNRAHLIKFKDNGSLEDYNHWTKNISMVGTSPLLFPTGVGGTLYPPHTLSDEVFNEDAFLRLCPKGDDIWFKAMSLLNNTQSYKVATHAPYYYSIPNMQDIGLYQDNVFKGNNNIQIANVFTEYNLYERFKSVRSLGSVKV